MTQIQKAEQYEVEPDRAWVNEMKAHEYNPFHYHTGIKSEVGLSSVLVLKRPDTYGEEITRKGDICFYSELGWVGDDGKPTGEWRACDWDVNYTAIAVEKGTIECGGYDNIVWTNSNLTEYVCNEG